MTKIEGIVYGPDFCFHRGAVSMADGKFHAVELEEGPIPFGAEKGPYLLPGVTDIHFHGGAGYDFTGCDYEGLKKIAAFLAVEGTTSFVIASMTQSEELITRAYRNGAKLQKEQQEGKLPGTARILGVYMEGPFFSKEKKGAQPEQYLKNPHGEMTKRLAAAAEGLLKVVCVAPELPGAMEFIEENASQYRISLAHSAADYATAKEAIGRGATQVTHLFNGMMPFHHREPGLIGAAAESEMVFAELICDGVHVHESAVRAAFQLFGPKRIVLISDSLSANGAAEGQSCDSGGDLICLKNGAAVLSDGITLAGSVTSLFQCVRKAISFGIAPEDALRAAAVNPLLAAGVAKEAGALAAGRTADLLVCDQELQFIQVYAAGMPVLSYRC